MGIVNKIETFVNETKEMSLKQVMKKINDGYWEAEQDMKVGRHTILRDIKTKKRITVYIKEDLDEGFKVKTGLQGALSINGKSIAKTEKVGNNVFVMIDKEDGDKTRIPVPNGKNMMASEIAEWLEEYLKKNPKALTESSYEKDLDPKKKIVVKGVKGMKSKPFTKKFKNMDAFDKWSDSDEFGDYEVHQIMNEDFDDSELEELDSISEATFAQHMKKAVEAKERGDKKKTLYHLGNAKTARYAMKSTEITKNKELLDKYKEMTKNLDESELDEAAKMPLTLKIGDSFKTDEGSIKITDITVSSLHMNPITYITYKYDVVIDGKPLKGEEKAALNSFKEHFKK